MGRLSSASWRFVAFIANSDAVCRLLVRAVMSRFTSAELGINLKLLTGPTALINMSDKMDRILLKTYVKSTIELLSGSSRLGNFASRIADFVAQEEIRRAQALETPMQTMETPMQTMESTENLDVSFVEQIGSSNTADNENALIIADTSDDYSSPAPGGSIVSISTLQTDSNAARRLLDSIGISTTAYEGRVLARTLDFVSDAALILLTIVIVSAIGGPLAIAVGSVLLVVLLIRAIISFTALMSPPSSAEQLSDIGENVSGTAKQLKESLLTRLAK